MRKIKRTDAPPEVLGFALERLDGFGCIGDIRKSQ